MARLRDGQVHGFGADELDVGAGGVEVRVVGDDVTRVAGHAEQDALGSAALVRGDHVLVAEDVLNGIAKAGEAAAAGIAFVALHNRGPLRGRHGAGAGVSQQVDEHVICGQQKQVVVRESEQFFALLTRGPTDGFDALDAKWLNDGFGGHGGLLRNHGCPSQNQGLEQRQTWGILMSSSMLGFFGGRAQ